MTLTRPEIITLLHSEHLVVDAGCDLLDSNDMFIEDVSANLVLESSTVEFDHESVVRTTAKLGFDRALDWPRIRLRPWITIANGPDADSPSYLTERWNLGVFLAETPARPLGQEPVHYDVDCYDKLVLLDTPVGRTVHLEKGDPLLDFASALIRPDLLSAIQGFSVDTDLDGVADGWVIASTGSPTATSQSLEFVEGRHFQRFAATTATTAVRYLTTTATGTWPAIGSVSYTIRLQTQGTAGTSSQARFALSFFDSTTAIIGTPLYTVLPIEEVWVPTEIRVVAPMNAVTMGFTIDLLSTDGDSTATVLDVYRPSIVRTDYDDKIFRDSTAAMRVAHKEETWPVGDATHAIEIINKVLQQAGCRNLYADRYGNYRMDRLPNEGTDAAIWAFDWDSVVSLVGLERTETVDLWDVPNVWVFIRTVDPAEEDAPEPEVGYLTVTNEIDGPASVSARAGRVVRSVHQLDSSDQISFEAAAAAIVRDEGSPVHTVEADTSPVPEIWDRQVVTYSDSGIEGDVEFVTPIRMTTDQWSLPLDGSNQSFTFSVISDLVLSAPAPATITGGDEEYDYNGYHYCVFTTVGEATLTVAVPGAAQALAIGGGGGGGGTAFSTLCRAGGGGGGEIRLTTIALTGNETVTVGAAGTGGAGHPTGGQGGVGGTSSVGALAVAAGGGGGGGVDDGLMNGVNGGSGGGGGTNSTEAGLGANGTAGNDGGDAFEGEAEPGVGGGGGGGGGAGSDGETPTASDQGGAGGAGVLLASLPDDLYYAAGGGGGAPFDGEPGEGGSDGAGGTGAQGNTNATAGQTPGSGGGGGAGIEAGAAGAAGMVVVRAVLP